MITHVIYHIDGKKVGCTRNLGRRKVDYPKGTVIEVLEELHDKTDQEAGDVEWAWADKLGYKRENHYTVSRHPSLVMTPEQRIEISRKGGLRAGELGRSGFQNLSTVQQSELGRRGASKLTFEQRSVAGKKGGSKGGLRRAEVFTHEQLSEISRRGRAKQIEATTPEQRSAIAKKAAETKRRLKDGGARLI